MRYRHWFLVAALLPLGFAFGFIRFNFSFVNFGGTDIWAAVALSIACAAVWTCLEIASHVLDARRLQCRCGYSLRGVRCPECGREIG